MFTTLPCRHPPHHTIAQAKDIADKAGATIILLGTTPAHNTASVADDKTVVALNAAAKTLAAEMGVQFVDLHTPLINACGPVPWADTGANACHLCAPNCKKLSVHYTTSGYDFIADLIWNAAPHT